MDKVIGLIAANYRTDAMGVLTAERTVASMPYGGRYRFIDFPLSNMINGGIQTVGIVTPYKYRSIIDHIGAGKEWSLDRKNGGLFVLPGSVFGISGGNTSFLLRDIERNKIFLLRSPAPFVLVSAANTIYNMDYAALYEAHISSGADITLAWKRASEDNANLTGIVEKNGRVTGTVQGVKKGEKAFLDCFVINRSLLLKIIDWYTAINYLGLFDVLEREYDKMDVQLYEFDGYATTILDSRSYFQHSMDLLDPAVNEELFFKERPIMTKVQDSVPAKYLPGARVQNSLISAGCLIKGTVEGSILFRNVKVEEGAVVRNSILMQSCVIGPGAVLENTIIDRRNVIAANTVIKGSAEAPFIKEKNDV